MDTIRTTIAGIQEVVSGICQDACRVVVRSLPVVDLARSLFARLSGRHALRYVTVPVTKYDAATAARAMSHGTQSVAMLHSRLNWRPTNQATRLAGRGSASPHGA